MVLTNNAIEYTIKCIADIAFPQKECHVEISDVPTLVVDSGIVVKFNLPDDSNMELLYSGKALYSNVKSYDGKVTLKVFSLTENAPLFSCEDKIVHVNFDM
ncbi:MAG: hypothetical protein IIT38_05915, partial [Bacteroidales bacterium]|nr:hypothetical protein [Bacteroidales bacterium]